MTKIHFKGSVNDKIIEHQFKLSLFSFIDDGVRIIYSPALDLSGYGKTIAEAKISFELTLEEFVRYTTNKNSLQKELKRLGWEIKKKSKPYSAPELSSMLQKNDYLASIFETKDFKKYNETVALPL
jgi:hypothetical protein